MFSLQKTVMCDRPRIHVFLGVPPPSSDPDLVSEDEVEGKEHPPAGWRHLELNWRHGHLQPAAATSGEEERTDREYVEADRSTLRLQGQNDNWTTETSQGQEGREGQAISDGKFNPEKESQCWASVHEYLDGCFHTTQPEAEPPHRPKQHDLSIQTQYLTTWTLSQTLILKGRQHVQSASCPEKIPPPQSLSSHALTLSTISSSTPELFSPVTQSPGSSTNLFSQPHVPPSAEEGGVVLQATTDGMLCSQATERHDSPSKSPNFKKDFRTETITAGPRGTPTLLAHCDKVGERYSVLVAVVHPCHLKEVKVKSGLSAGTFVPLASIVVTDQSAIEMKVLLWRRAAFWALTTSPGDILLITGLQVSEDRWRGETLLHSTFSSKLLNLGHITGFASPTGKPHLTNQLPLLQSSGYDPPSAPQQLDARTLSSLCGFLREWRPLLVSIPHCPPQDLNRLPYTTLRSLRINTLVHMLLRVIHSHTCTEWRGEAESRCRSALQLKAVVTVEQPYGQEGMLLLWGAAVDWLPLFNRNKTTVWNVRFLLVKEGLTSDLPELHSTPWSSAQPLDAADRRAQGFLLPPLLQSGNCNSLELDLGTLLSQKYSGEAETHAVMWCSESRLLPSSSRALHLPRMHYRKSWTAGLRWLVSWQH
ncbi:hypothetical protein PAMP_002030 [Pampus punctatissimus]